MTLPNLRSFCKLPLKPKCMKLTRTISLHFKMILLQENFFLELHLASLSYQRKVISSRFGKHTLTQSVSKFVDTSLYLNASNASILLISEEAAIHLRLDSQLLLKNASFGERKAVITPDASKLFVKLSALHYGCMYTSRACIASFCRNR